MCMLCKCKNDKKNSFTTHVVNYSNSVIIIKNVPCEECEQCGEIFYTDEVAEQLEKTCRSGKKVFYRIFLLSTIQKLRNQYLKY